MIVRIYDQTGDFAEDKDVAASIREETIRPTIVGKNEVVLDFDGVTLATQSFVHALISDVLRSVGEDSLNYLDFWHCASGVRGIIETVVQYSREALEDVSSPNDSGTDSVAF